MDPPCRGRWERSSSKEEAAETTPGFLEQWGTDTSQEEMLNTSGGTTEGGSNSRPVILPKLIYGEGTFGNRHTRLRLSCRHCRLLGKIKLRTIHPHPGPSPRGRRSCGEARIERNRLRYRNRSLTGKVGRMCTLLLEICTCTFCQV